MAPAIPQPPLPDPDPAPEPQIRGGQSGRQDKFSAWADRGAARETLVVGVRADPGRAALDATRQAGVSGKRSAREGGGRAGSAAGGFVGRPRWPRILRSTLAASIVAMTDMRPPQRGHARTSRSKTRRIKSAHLQSRGFSGGFGSFVSGG